MLPKVTEVVLPLEEPVNIHKRFIKGHKAKICRAKSQGKESKKPSVEKKEIVKETKIPGSPTCKTVAKKQTKVASKNETN